MAVIKSKKSFFGIHKIKKVIKNLIKKTRKSKPVKEEPAPQITFEAEIEENLANEAMELRLRQLIAASPVTLDESFNLKGAMILTVEPQPEIQFGTFWVSDDDDSFSLCDLPLPSPPPSVSSRKSAAVVAASS